jgi:hypothetical protein
VSSSSEWVPDPEVLAKARSRRYSASYKAKILAEYQELDKAGKGALLRREGLYMSLIAAWRTQRDQGALAASAKPAGRSVGSGECQAAQGGRAPGRRAGQGSEGDRGAGKALRAVGSARDRQPDERERAHAMTDEAITELAPLVGTREACRVTGRPQANHYRRHRQSPAPQRPKRERKPQPRALSTTERAQVRAVLNSPEHVDKAPAAVYHELLDEGTYLASVSTMYRVLREHGEVRERRRQAVHPARVKPELVATGPNSVWSWDITKLAGPAKWLTSTCT